MSEPTQQDAEGVVWCSAIRKPPRFAGQRCNGFVGRFAGPVRVVALVLHSRDADPGHDVIPCRRCGFLHEIRRMEPATKRLAA